MKPRQTHTPLFSLAVLALVWCMGSYAAKAQCTISTFPYFEGFESGPAWSDGGTNSDWAWGTPAHPTISAAGGGTKSWCVGGLTGSFYNYSQSSWLMSPCMDFTTLVNPTVSFKLFWENEWQWDGFVFQYSIDGGSSWVNVGSYNDPDDCMTQNWYNHNNVSWLITAWPKHGWSGRIGSTSGSCSGGNGSGGWVTAKHCIGNLAGRPNVLFRFYFGSGSTCNNFDGIAVDDILIEEAPANNISFTAACDGNTVSFSAVSTQCPTHYQWNFGDPASGAANTSTAMNPAHTFSGPGTYNVSLTAWGDCYEHVTDVQTISILDVTTTSTDASCVGATDGSATVIPAHATGALSYSWNTTPVQNTPTATNLAAGNYTVEVTDASGCSASENVTVSEPEPLELAFTTFNSCAGICTGSAEVTAGGGTAPYTYVWSTLGPGNVFTDMVCAGTYTVTVTDAHNCMYTDTTEVGIDPTPVISANGGVICLGQAVVLSASGAAAYSWSPLYGLSNGTGAVVTANPGTTTTYTVTGISGEGCAGIANVIVNVIPLAAPVAAFTWLPELPTVYEPAVSFNNTSQGAVSYQWDFAGLGTSGAIHPQYIFPADSGGIYTVCLQAQNDSGCVDTVCREVRIQGSPGVFLPNAFTPNGDGVNDYFFPYVSDMSSDEYTFTIFDRWGGVVYTTGSIGGQWDGSRKGQACMQGTYVWTINCREKEAGINHVFRGHVTLLR